MISSLSSVFSATRKKARTLSSRKQPLNPSIKKDFHTKIKGKSQNRLILGFNKFTIPDDKVFEIEVYERNGGRHINLAVLNEYILSAEPLYQPQP